jgi:putative ABC transport system permease protein
VSSRDLLGLVASNLNRMRARVFLTAIGVTIGTAAVIVLISLGVGLQQSAMSSLGQFGDVTQITVTSEPLFGPADPTQAGRTEPLTAASLREITALPHVLAVTPRVRLDGGGTLTYARDDYFGDFQGVDPAAAGRLEWKLAAGADRIGKGTIVVGSGVFASGGDSGRSAADSSPESVVGRAVTLKLEKTDDEGEIVTRSDRLRVAGVLEESGGADDFTIYMGLDDVEDANRWFTGTRTRASDGYGEVLVKADDRTNVRDLQESINAMGFETFSALDILEAVNQFALIVQGVLGGLGAVALLVAAFGIANTMTMAIYERTREIGIMKALGATNRDVLRIFLAEAGAIGVLGGLAGAVIGWSAGIAIDLIIRNLVIANSGGTTAAEDIAEISVTPVWLLVFAVVFAACVGLVSGVYPALRAASMKPLAALRTE